MSWIGDALEEWLNPILIESITDRLTGLFDTVNDQVGTVVSDVGKTPASWNSGVHNMIRNLSDNVILPIAGVILAAVMTLELIHLITDKNDLKEFDLWMLFRWVFRSAAAILIVSHTWDIVMGVFDTASSVVHSASEITGAGALDTSSLIANLQTQMQNMSLGALLELWFSSGLIWVATAIMRVIIFIVLYGRMMEIYLVTSMAPIPLSTMLNKNWSSTGQNYLRTLFSLAFQAFLIIVCVAIYSVLLGSLAVTEDVNASLWECVGYTALLCFMLFKTGSLSKQIFGAH